MRKNMFVKSVKYIILLIVLAGIGFGTYQYFQYKKIYPTTDDAYINGHIVNIAAQINGQVDSINIQNHAHVQQGQLLFTINSKPFQIDLAKAQANLENTQQTILALKSDIITNQALLKQRQAELVNTKKTAKRIISLVKQHALAVSQQDDIISKVKVAQAAVNAANAQLNAATAKLGKLNAKNAQIKAAEAAVAEAKLQLSYSKIYAPTSGYINKLTLRHGDTITAFQPIFSLVGDKHWWVNANYKETQLNRIHEGQTAFITLDMYPDHRYIGKVVSISTGSGAAFALLPAENATGNWVKVTQRFPVWVSIHDSKKFPLRIGASATVTINTKK